MLSYRGQEIPVLTAPPDWQRGVTAVQSHETIVARSLSGVEDRRQRRPRPLWSLRYQALTLSARETGYVRGVMLAAREMPVAVPYWPQAVALTEDASGSASELAHDSVEDLYLFAGEHWALLYEHALSWEVARVTGEEPDVPEQPLAGAWPAGTMLVPLLIGHLVRPATAHQTDAAGTWQIDFREKFLPISDS